MERRARPERAVEGVLDAEQAVDRRRVGRTHVAVGPLPAVRPRLARVLLTCVEINQCVGCTQKFFTKSFLSDGAAVLARSSGEERASPRHRAGVASMAWRTTRCFSTNAP